MGSIFYLFFINNKNLCKSYHRNKQDLLNICIYLERYYYQFIPKGALVSVKKIGNGKVNHHSVASHTRSTLTFKICIVERVRHPGGSAFAVFIKKS